MRRADRVTVELIVHKRTGERFCSAEGVFYEESHELAAPLGERLIIDLTSGEALSHGPQ